MEEKSYNPEKVNQVEERLKLENRFKNGADWFFWIAGLSLVNSIILLVGGSWSFLVGLGLMQVIDGIALGIVDQGGSEGAIIIKSIAFVADILIAGIFVAFGVLARKKYKWSFIAGMTLYALDGLIFLMVQDFLSIGFHLFALFGLYGGFQAHKKLSEMETAKSAVTEYPEI
jgi:hypothetical protein